MSTILIHNRKLQERAIIRMQYTCCALRSALCKYINLILQAAGSASLIAKEHLRKIKQFYFKAQKQRVLSNPVTQFKTLNMKVQDCAAQHTLLNAQYTAVHSGILLYILGYYMNRRVIHSLQQ